MNAQKVEQDTQNTIEITTLGQLRVQQNGQLLDDFISIKAVLLLVYLAMHPSEHSRKKLASLFWSETNDQQALKNLRTILSSIRQKLPDAMRVQRDSLAINPEAGIQVDASLFEDGFTYAFSASDSPFSLADMQKLAELYQGPFLADVSFRDAAALDEWISDKQRQLEQLNIQLLYEITERAQQQANYEIGLQYAKRLVSLDPYWDAARCQLMRLLAYTNRSNEALRQYEAFAKLLDEELASAPAEETTTLYEQIRARHIRLPQQRAAQSSIILPDMPFVESLDDIGLAQRMLNTPQCHLLTIYGISGIGKTALATQIAFHRQNLYQDGAHLVSLKHTQSARDLPYMIANTLGIPVAGQLSPPELEDLVLEYLKSHHLLLVLDNYEHLLPETDFVNKILEQASRMQLVVTSQAPLNLFREWLLPLQGLRVPSEADENPETFESVRLFELTAQRINPRFNLRDNLAGVVQICQLVDGLPLALIIAAGWTQIIPINKIKEYIIEGQEFSLPVQQDLPSHHQSLEMMLDYTWNTLAPAEQYALMALSIFNTYFDIEEVQQICAVDLEVFTAMIQKSLIQKYADKYRLHQLIWRYARKKLLYSDKKEMLSWQYRQYVLESLRELQRQKLPLHEYLLAIEMQYASIWNYDWMPKSFQPLYILSLSRFLIAYWETSRSDELPHIQALFQAIPINELATDAAMLLHLQLARFAILSGHAEGAYQQIDLLLSDNVLTASWADWGEVFNLCMLIFDQMASANQSAPSQIETDIAILNSAYLKLLSLYLDMCDYEAVESLFPHLHEHVQQPIDQALIWAIQGTISAELGQFAPAIQHFSTALQHLEQVPEPLLKLPLHTLAMRAAAILKDDQRACEHLRAALDYAAALNAAPALLELLNFCAELPHVSAQDDYSKAIQASIEQLQNPSLRSPNPDHLKQIAAQVSLMSKAC